MKAKEAYQKIPMMCLKFYERHLIWNKVDKPKVEEKAEPEAAPKPESSEGSQPTETSATGPAASADPTPSAPQDDEDALPDPVPADV